MEKCFYAINYRTEGEYQMYHDINSMTFFPSLVVLHEEKHKAFATFEKQLNEGDLNIKDIVMIDVRCISSAGEREEKEEENFHLKFDELQEKP
jgi:hypothetical protein